MPVVLLMVSTWETLDPPIMDGVVSETGIDTAPASVALIIAAADVLSTAQPLVPPRCLSTFVANQILALAAVPPEKAIAAE
jgi:hypothetical protein